MTRGATTPHRRARERGAGPVWRSLLVGLLLGSVATCQPLRNAEPAIPGEPDRPEPHIVRIFGFQFSPAEQRVGLGDTVMWLNEDPFAHTTTADSGAWTSPELKRNQRYAFIPRRSGRFPYHCAAHPGMKGVLIVGAQ
jgi:plastocyanin